MQYFVYIFIYIRSELRLFSVVQRNSNYAVQVLRKGEIGRRMRHEHYNDLFRLILLLLDWKKKIGKLRNLTEIRYWRDLGRKVSRQHEPLLHRNESGERIFFLSRIFQLTTIDCIGEKIDRRNDQINFFRFMHTPSLHLLHWPILSAVYVACVWVKIHVLWFPIMAFD